MISSCYEVGPVDMVTSLRLLPAFNQGEMEIRQNTLQHLLKNTKRTEMQKNAKVFANKLVNHKMLEIRKKRNCCTPHSLSKLKVEIY